MKRSIVCAALFASLALVAACAETDEGEATEDIKVCAFYDDQLEDRTAGLEPLLPGEDLEVVAELPFPPGNVGVAADGRTFISFFPDSNKGPAKVAELVDGKPVAYPSLAFQKTIDSVLGLKIDRQGWLWLVDHGGVGVREAQLVAVDLASNTEVFRWKLPRSIAGVGSTLNDIQISPDGFTLYLADTSLVKNDQALIVVDISGSAPVARRVLENDVSVDSGDYAVHVHGKQVKTARFLCLEYGVDGVALDQTGEWLYYSALNGGDLWRVRTSDLRDAGLPAGDLAARVEWVAPITMSDGMTSDGAGNIYLTDMEHSQIVRVDPSGRLDVVMRDPRLRWPDGFSWAPDGSLYVTASALHLHMPEVVKTGADIAKHAPYHLLRLWPMDACGEDQACWGEPGQ